MHDESKIVFGCNSLPNMAIFFTGKKCCISLPVGDAKSPSPPLNPSLPNVSLEHAKGQRSEDTAQSVFDLLHCTMETAVIK